MTNGHEKFADVVELYALDALPDDERTAFEAHLAKCAICAEDLRQTQQTVATLAASQAKLPDGLRERVLTAVDNDFSSRRRRQRPSSKQPLLWLAAACALVVAISIATITWRTTNQEPSTPVAQQAAVASVMSAPDMTKATGSVDRGSVAAMYAPSQRATVVATNDLPPIAPNMMYQIWITVGGNHKSAGMVPGGSAGTSTVVMTDMDRPTNVGLSVEPARGSSEPTSAMVVDFAIR